MQRHPFDNFERKDVRFMPFHCTMETVFQQLHKEDIGAETKHTSVITEEKEALIWERKVIGCHSPLALVRAVFYLNGKNLGERALRAETI